MAALAEVFRRRKGPSPGLLLTLTAEKTAAQGELFPAAAVGLCFSFIHCAEEVAIESFKTHLMHYEPLFRSLDRFRLWGVSTDRRVLEKMRVFAGDYLEGAEYDQRVEHYKLERLFRQKRIAEMGQKGLDRLRDLRRLYSERTGQWKPAENKPLPGTFHPYLLRHSYKALATLIHHWWN